MLIVATMAMFAGMVVNAQGGNDKRGGRGFGGQSEIILEATGLTSDELHDALQNGSTIADLIEANGSDVDSVISELVSEITTNINERVASGSLTQEQADTIIDGLDEKLTAKFNGTFERPEDSSGRRGRRGFNNDDEADTTEDA